MDFKMHKAKFHTIIDMWYIYIIADKHYDFDIIAQTN